MGTGTGGIPAGGVWPHTERLRAGYWYYWWSYWAGVWDIPRGSEKAFNTLQHTFLLRVVGIVIPQRTESVIK